MGSAVRPYLGELADKVILSSRDVIDNLAPHEEFRPAELSDFHQVRSILDGCDAVIHLGGYSTEGPFKPILDANIVGTYNLYEAARATGQPRILFASTNHVIGYYPQNVKLKGDVMHRPDSLYGVSKSFGESLARFYFDKFGQETAIVRIGSCLKKPTDYRQLSTWLSVPDFVQLVEKVFTVPQLGCPIIYGASANERSWWNNSEVSYLGWSPQDNSEIFAGEIEAAIPNPDPNDPTHLYQGGHYIDFPIMTEQSDD